MTTVWEVGQFYRVPCVKVDDWHGFKDCWIPVIGPMHEDAEFVKFPWDHFHVNWGFVNRDIWRSIGNLGYDNHHFAYPIQHPDRHGTDVIIAGPELRRLKCKRQPGCFPREKAKWTEKMETAFACAKLVNGVCPHRGIPVSAMHREGDILTCPGHGLQWNAVTGLLHRPSTTSNSCAEKP